VLRSAYAREEISTATLDLRLGLVLRAPTRQQLRELTVDLAGGLRRRIGELIDRLTARPEPLEEAPPVQTLSLTLLETSHRGPDLVVGRHRDCSVVVADDAASRHHARLALADGCWYLEDLQSLNGTYLNGARIVRAPVLCGDVIQVGRALFRVA
jgi:predicted component of type VI protein secretion system